MSDDDLRARVEALEARVRELEDDRAIRELLARYGFTADTCNDDGYLDLYTDDGAIDLGISDQSMYEGIVRFEGREQLRAFITDPNAHHRPGFYGRSMHLMGNNLVTHVDGDTAVVNSYNLTFQETEDGTIHLLAGGNNQWTLRRENGRWRIAERRRREIGGPGYTTNLDATPD